jgi:hypothetical protein
MSPVRWLWAQANKHVIWTSALHSGVPKMPVFGGAVWWTNRRTMYSTTCLLADMPLATRRTRREFYAEKRKRTIWCRIVCCTTVLLTAVKTIKYELAVGGLWVTKFHFSELFLENIFTGEYCPTKATVFSEMGHNSLVNHIRVDSIHQWIVSGEIQWWETAYTRTPVFEFKGRHKMSSTEFDAVRPACATKKMPSIDFLRPLPKTTGKEVSISSGRLLNEWVEVYPLPDQHATTVTQVVVNKELCRPYRNVSRLDKWSG